MAIVEADRARRADPRRAFYVVDQFEQELCSYTGAPFAVALDSCTNALFLTLWYERQRLELAAFQAGERDLPIVLEKLRLPARTYIGVLQAARNAGWSVEWTKEEWQHRGWYTLWPSRVVDAARRFDRSIWNPALGEIVCLSFHASKQLPLGRGGAVLTDDEELVEWLRRARADGRPEGRSPVDTPMFPAWHCFMPPPTAALGLWILASSPESRPMKPAFEDPDLSLLP